MFYLLQFLIIYIFFSFFIIGFFLSKVKFNINNFEYETNIKETHKKLKINIGIYLYGHIKIIAATLEDDGVRVFGKKINYKTFKFFEPFRNVDYRSLRKDFDLNELRKWKMELEKLDLKLDIGFENVLFTSFSIFLASTLLSLFAQKTIRKYDSKKYKYVIKPHYRENNNIKLNASGIISVKTVHIINILYKYKKRRAKEYERTSYRRSYENSYE